jgi:hypothetical protein
MFGKDLISYGEKRNIINEIIDSHKRQIVACEVTIRWLEREKIKGQNLLVIEDMLKKNKEFKNELEEKLKVALDIQKESQQRQQKGRL